MIRRCFGFVMSILVLMALVIGGCAGQQSSGVGTPSASTSSPTPQSSTAAPTSTSANGPIKLVDSAGKTVELARVPQRIVVVGQGPYMALHTMFMFPEAKTRVVGMERKGATVSDFLPFVDSTFNNKAILDTNPNTEQIATLNPDLVILKSTTVDSISPGLEKLGIPVFRVGLESPEQYLKDVTNLGVIFGNEARAKEITAYYQSKLDRIAKGVAKVDAQKRSSVLIVQYSERNNQVAVQVPSKAYMQTVQAQTGGGNPVWLDAAVGDSWTVVNLEQIVSWNPDKIVVVVFGGLDSAQVIAKLKADPQWAGLKAVQNDQMYAYPSDIFGWDSPEPRWILGMTWMAKRINPDQFADVDMKQELYEFFSTLYGMDKASVDKNIMPKVQMDIH